MRNAEETTMAYGTFLWLIAVGRNTGNVENA